LLDAANRRPRIAEGAAGIETPGFSVLGSARVVSLAAANPGSGEWRPVAAGSVHIDRRGRPRLYLAASLDAPDHRVILESVEPIVRGFCETCFEDWSDSPAAGRKARSCDVMVRFLAGLNRDRASRARLADEVEEARRAAQASR